jgi:hypothetical protein
MKLSSQVSVFAAVLALASAFSPAETIQLGSYQTGGPNLGNNNTAVAFVGSTTTTFALDPGGVWAAPGSNSVWVSNNAGSGPTGGFIAPSGTYTYTTTFNTLAGNTYTGAISLLADDTADVFLNGHSLLSLGILGTNKKCADSGPNCTTPTLVVLPSAFFVTGLNVLQFDLTQTIASAGLDFSGSAIGTVGSTSPVPEPGTLFLLGTGLIASAGLLMRRFSSLTSTQ